MPEPADHSALDAGVRLMPLARNDGDESLREVVLADRAHFDRDDDDDNRDED